jgi:hypothetical protein
VPESGVVEEGGEEGSQERTSQARKVDTRARTLTEGRSPESQRAAAEPVLTPYGPAPAARGSFQSPFTDLVGAGVTPAGIVCITAREKGAQEKFNNLLFKTVLTKERTAMPKVERRSLRDHLAS